MALTDKLKAIADAIRGKTGKTDTLTLDQMATEITDIQIGGDSGSSLETCAVNFFNNTSVDVVIWYVTVTNGNVSHTMESVREGKDKTFDVLRYSLLSFLPMGGSMGSVHIDNAMLVSSCEHLGSIVVGTQRNAMVSVAVNAPTT